MKTVVDFIWKKMGFTITKERSFIFIMRITWFANYSQRSCLVTRSFDTKVLVVCKK